MAAALTAAVAAVVELFCCVFTMGLCHARWEGAAFVGFGLGKTKHVGMVMCQLTLETNRRK